MIKTKRDLYFDYLYNRFLKIGELRVSRGCERDCYFCDIPHKEGREANFISAGKIKKRLLQLWNQGYRHIDFVDDNFLLYGEKMQKILKGLIEKGYGFTFSFNAPVDRLIQNQKLLTPLKHLGLRAITLQIINSNEKVIERYGMDISRGDQQYAIQILQALQIQIELDYILFDPMTTIDDLRNDYDFLEKNKLLGIAPFNDVLTTYLDLSEEEPNPPDEIFEPDVREILNWMLYFEQEFGSRWHEIHYLLQKMRIKLAKEKPNWKVTNVGQELLHITLALRIIPYKLFKGLLSNPGARINQQSLKRKCERQLAGIEESFWQYRKCYGL